MTQIGGTNWSGTSGRTDLNRVLMIRQDLGVAVDRGVYEYSIGELKAFSDHRVEWDGRDRLGNQVPSGVYYSRLEASEFAEVRKLTLIKHGSQANLTGDSPGSPTLPAPGESKERHLFSSLEVVPMRFALSFLLLLALPAGAEDTVLATGVDAFAQPYEEAGHLSGSLLVARGDEVLVERSYGMANYETLTPNGPDSRFGVASINKPITIILCARMVDRGDLDLTATIGTYLPGFPKADELIVADLLNHTAGVPHRVTEPHEECVARTPEDLVELVVAKGLDESTIGERNYSSAGYAVLARVLEIAGGAPYSELLEELVLEPASAESTQHPEGGELIPHRAQPYFLIPGGLKNAQPKDLSFLVGGGALFSTARDLHAIMQTLVTGGFGTTAQAYAVRGREEFSWSGSTSGYRSSVKYRAEDDLTIVFLSNIQSGAVFRILDAVDSLLAGSPVDDPGPPEITFAGVDPALLESLTGEYQMRPGTTLDVHTDGTLLYSSEWPLVPQGGRRFFSMQDYGPVEFVPAEDGSIERLDWYWMGAAEAMAMPRIGAGK